MPVAVIAVQDFTIGLAQLSVVPFEVSIFPVFPVCDGSAEPQDKVVPFDSSAFPASPITVGIVANIPQLVVSVEGSVVPAPAVFLR